MNLQQSYELLKNTIKEKEVEHKLIKKDYERIKTKLTADKYKLEVMEKAKNFILFIGKSFQTGIKKLYEDTTTLALNGIITDNIHRNFKMEFKYDKRDQLEIKFFIVENGKFLEPRENTSSGGAINVCAFALQMICMKLEQKLKNISPILLMDEPFKDISEGYLPATGRMLKTLVEKHNIQIIMATHIQHFIDSSDHIVYTKVDSAKTPHKPLKKFKIKRKGD